MALYDLDRPPESWECPKCRFTMERLNQSFLLDRRGGFLLDTGVHWDPDDHIVTSALFGSLTRFLARHFLEPIGSRLFFLWRNFCYRRALRRYPRSLVCPHCHHIEPRR